MGQSSRPGVIDNSYAYIGCVQRGSVMGLLMNLYDWSGMPAANGDSFPVLETHGVCCIEP